MANKFFPRMPNLVEVLNQMWDAFAAGPYNAVPLTGGTMTGPLAGRAGLFAATDTTSSALNVTSGVLNVYDGADPVSEQLVEAARFGVRGIPSISFNGAWRVYTSSGPGYFHGNHTLSIFASDTSAGNSSIAALKLHGSGEVDAGGVLTSFGMRPDVDNLRTVGSAALAYATIFARTGTINTSDARFKCDWADLSASEIAAACALARAVRSYRWIDAVAEKGLKARRHIGPTVQAAIEIMTAHGLDPFDYGFICHDEWAERVIEHPAIEGWPAMPPADGMPGSPAVEARAAYTETIPAGDRYAFRYAELSMFIAAGQAAQQDALEQRIAALEAMP